MLESRKIAEGLYLCTQRIDERKAASEAPQVVAPPVDHVVVIDVSYSMEGELPLLREHLKQRLCRMVAEGDTLSIVWFSGRGQHGTLLTEQSIQGLLDVKTVSDLVDRFIRPVGMTGFKEPLEDCAKVLSQLRKKRPDALASLLFMSDGCDNQWPREEIFKALSALYGKFQASTFVEYGYYADRKLLTAMAEKMGGAVVCAEDFPGFQPVLEKSVLGTAPPRAFCKLEVPGCKDFVFSVVNGDLQVYEDLDGVVTVPCDPLTKAPAHDVCWISKESVGASVGEGESFSSELAAIAAYGYRMRGDLVKPLLLDLREGDLLTAFSRCFGKQRYSEFSDKALKLQGQAIARVTDTSSYFRSDLPTLLDLLDVLGQADATAMIEHAAFKYDRITKKTVNKDPFAPKFRANGLEGYPISGIVLNVDRPNISMRLQKHGTLDLGSAPDKPLRLPKEISAFQWRNYALVADGIVHVDLLPVRVPAPMFKELRETRIFRELDAAGAFRGVSDEGAVFGLMIDLEKVGLINEEATLRPSGKNLAEWEVSLLLAQCKQKVWKHYRDTYAPPQRVDGALAAVFGEAEAKWLADKGFKGGLYNPPKKADEVKDVYKAVELQTKIKSYGTLPKIDEVIARSKTDKPMTPSMAALWPHIESAESVVRAYKGKDLSDVLEARAKESIADARHQLYGVARRKFAIVLGQTWFHDAKEPGVYETTVASQGTTFEVKIALAEVDVEV